MSAAILTRADEVTGRDIVPTFTSQEGGELQNSERRAKLVVQNNGGVLADARCRKFLTAVMNDRRSAMYDDNVNAFVKHAQAKLKAAGITISRERAMRLYRLFTIRGSNALAEAMKLHEENNKAGN